MTLRRLKGRSSRAGECTSCQQIVVVATLSNNERLVLDRYWTQLIDGKVWVDDAPRHECGRPDEAADTRRSTARLTTTGGTA